MKEPTTIYGRSDDLIEVEGGVQKELYANYGEPTTVHVGPFTFEVVYTNDGEWEITPETIPDGRVIAMWGVGGHPGRKDYTQVIEFDADPEWEVSKE